MADDGTVAEITATRGIFSTLSPELLVLSPSPSSSPIPLSPGEGGSKPAERPASRFSDDDDPHVDGDAGPNLNRQQQTNQVVSRLCKRSEDPNFHFAIGSQRFICPSIGQDSTHTLHLRLNVTNTRSPVLFGLATGPPHHLLRMQLPCTSIET